MDLQELFDYKNRCVRDILTNERIVALLHDDQSPVMAAEDYVYRQVFPYEYIPETIEQA